MRSQREPVRCAGSPSPCLITAGLLLPVIVAIWTVPGFVTQDGPTHLYNAWILSRSFDPGSPYQAFLPGELAARAELGGASLLSRGSCTWSLPGPPTGS